jgi:hypothetical protein
MKCFNLRVAELIVFTRGISFKTGNMTEISEITYFGGPVQAFRVTR